MRFSASSLHLLDNLVFNLALVFSSLTLIDSYFCLICFVLGLSVAGVSSSSSSSSSLYISLIFCLISLIKVDLPAPPGPVMK